MVDHGNLCILSVECSPHTNRVVLPMVNKIYSSHKVVLIWVDIKDGYQDDGDGVCPVISRSRSGWLLCGHDHGLVKEEMFVVIDGQLGYS